MITLCIKHEVYHQRLDWPITNPDKVLHEAGYTYMDMDEKNQEVILRLANLIYEIYEPKFLRTILKRDFYYEDEEEIQTILRFTRFLSNHEDLEEESRGVNLILNKKIELIKSKLESFLAEGTQLHLEGFFRFRLKELWQEYSTLVESAIDEYMLEKEYKAYIGQLRELTTERNESVILLHLVQLGNERYQLYDQYEKAISYEIEGMNAYSTLIQEYDDLLVSKILTLNPQKIMLHSTNDQLLIMSTIKSIFYDRIEKCSGCAMCKQAMQNQG